MREIQLTQGYITLVDDEDYDRIVEFGHWQIKIDKTSAKGLYYARTNRWDKENNKCRFIALHRFILGLERGDKRQVDHIDGNGLNNQKSNLRICNSYKENSRNKYKSKFREFTSNYKGVNWKPIIKRWIAQISCDNKKVHIGCYKTQEEAARAYDKVAIELHGEFANLNFPMEELI